MVSWKPNLAVACGASSMLTPTDYFYTCTEDFDTTDCQDRDDAIRLALAQVPQDQWPETLTLYRWRHAKIDVDALVDPVVKTTIQHLDHLHRPPGQGFQLAHWADPELFKVIEAARGFLTVLVAHYPVEALEPVDSEEIVVADWVKQHSG